MNAGRFSARRIAIAALCAAGLTGVPFASVATAAAAGPTCKSFPDLALIAQAQATRREQTLDTLVAALQPRHDPFELNGTQMGALQQAKGGVAALEQSVQAGCYPTRRDMANAIRPLFTQYRVYWLRVPQTRVIEAADYLAEARARLGDAAAKLAPYASGNINATTDLNEMNVALAAADAKLGSAPHPSPSIAAVAGLLPAADMTADVGAIDAARTDLLAAQSSVASARDDAQRVLADLDAV